MFPVTFSFAYIFGFRLRRVFAFVLPFLLVFVVAVAVTAHNGMMTLLRGWEHALNGAIRRRFFQVDCTNWYPFIY